MNIYICVFYLKKKENSSQNKKILIRKINPFGWSTTVVPSLILLEYRNKRRRRERERETGEQ